MRFESVLSASPKGSALHKKLRQAIDDLLEDSGSTPDATRIDDFVESIMAAQASTPQAAELALIAPGGKKIVVQFPGVEDTVAAQQPVVGGSIRKSGSTHLFDGAIPDRKQSIPFFGTGQSALTGVKGRASRASRTKLKLLPDFKWQPVRAKQVKINLARGSKGSPLSLTKTPVVAAPRSAGPGLSQVLQPHQQGSSPVLSSARQAESVTTILQNFSKNIDVALAEPGRRAQLNLEFSQLGKVTLEAGTEAGRVRTDVTVATQEIKTQLTEAFGKAGVKPGSVRLSVAAKTPPGVVHDGEAASAGVKERLARVSLRAGNAGEKAQPAEVSGGSGRMIFAKDSFGPEPGVTNNAAQPVRQSQRLTKQRHSIKEEGLATKDSVGNVPERSIRMLDRRAPRLPVTGRGNTAAVQNNAGMQAAGAANEETALANGDAFEENPKHNGKTFSEAPDSTKSVAGFPDQAGAETQTAPAAKVSLMDALPGGAGQASGKAVITAQLQSPGLPAAIRKVSELAEHKLQMGAQKLEVEVEVKDIGKVLVDAVRHGDKISMQVQVDSHEVRRLLENQLRPLLEHLSKEGHDIAKLDVSVRDDQAGESRQNAWNQESRRGGPRWQDFTGESTQHERGRSRQEHKQIKHKLIDSQTVEIWA